MLYRVEGIYRPTSHTQGEFPDSVCVHHFRAAFYDQNGLLLKSGDSLVRTSDRHHNVRWELSSSMLLGGVNVKTVDSNPQTISSYLDIPRSPIFEESLRVAHFCCKDRTLAMRSRPMGELIVDEMTFRNKQEAPVRFLRVRKDMTFPHAPFVEEFAAAKEHVDSCAKSLGLRGGYGSLVDAFAAGINFNYYKDLLAAREGVLVADLSDEVAGDEDAQDAIAAAAMRCEAEKKLEAGYSVSCKQPRRLTHVENEFEAL